MWVREGSCCRCGECCTGTPPEELRVTDLMKRDPVVEGMCPLYEIHHGASEGEGFCIGHEPPNQDPYYLSGCNVWPDDPSQITNYPSCTYRFTWVD